MARQNTILASTPGDGSGHFIKGNATRINLKSRRTTEQTTSVSTSLKPCQQLIHTHLMGRVLWYGSQRCYTVQVDMNMGSALHRDREGLLCRQTTGVCNAVVHRDHYIFNS